MGLFSDYPIIRTIEHTWGAATAFDREYAGCGVYQITLSKEEVTALVNGDTLALTIGTEYTVTLTTKGELPIDE